MPTVYKPETYEVVSRWMEETPIRYGTNTKRGKSWNRYEAYAKAATVGEALRLGSKPEDLLFDFEHGHLEATGGPVREAAIDPTSVTDLSKLTKTDIVVSKWAGWGFREGDETRKLVRQLPDGSFKVIIMDYIHEHRKEANAMAASILHRAEQEGRMVRECEVLRVLSEWRFQKNDARQNVLPEGQDFVFSDTLGLIRARDGRYMEKEATREFPEVTKLLCRWLKDHRPADMAFEFPFTSINVNYKYAARRHRDGNNCGPSMIKALGNFTGGRLGYFPNDDHSTGLDDLPISDRIQLNLKEGLALFNGVCAHEVEDFEGERYSLVFFNISKYWKTPEEVKSYLVDCGICWPDEQTVERARRMLHAPRGYGPKASGGLSADSEGLPPVKLWPTDPEELAEADREAEERAKDSGSKTEATAGSGADAKAAARKQRARAPDGATGPAPPDGVEQAPTPARKRGRTEQAPETPAKTTVVVVSDEAAWGGKLEEETLARADCDGLRSALINLAGRPEVSAKGLSMPELLSVLRRSGGLVNAAKRMLLEDDAKVTAA